MHYCIHEIKHRNGNTLNNVRLNGSNSNDVILFPVWVTALSQQIICFPQNVCVHSCTQTIKTCCCCQDKILALHIQLTDQERHAARFPTMSSVVSQTLKQLPSILCKKNTTFHIDILMYLKCWSIFMRP